ncbi:MAG TPA: hypothetical protein VG873_05550 [Burkholderiales bacterium]|nr:hypothetical protein [Burkholderiales bacterium]
MGSGLQGLQFLATIDAGMALFQRYQRGAAFRGYVKRHGVEILFAALVLTAVALACTGATVVLVGGTSSWRVLLALVAAPIVLLANLGLLLYVFFSWVEARAVTTPHPRGRVGAWLHAKLRANLGAPPPVPWALAALFVGLPFLMLLWLSWVTALALALLVVLLPVLYARLDHAGIVKV